MNPIIKDRWSEALRSGEYQQTQRVLHNEEGFCCLGVLCDIHAKETETAWESDIDERTNRPRYKYLGDPEILPQQVVDWAGLEDCSPIVTIDREDDYDVYGTHEELSELNDSGTTFNEIADLIEKYL